MYLELNGRKIEVLEIDGENVVDASISEAIWYDTEEPLTEAEKELAVELNGDDFFELYYELRHSGS